MKFKDQLNTVFELKNTPQRIICLVPSITELLVDLGLQKQIVGITKFCVHPSFLIEEKMIIGGTKNIKIDTIKVLQPDIILCNKEENTKEIVENCRKISATHVSDIYTIADTLELIHQYGKIFSCEGKAKEIILNILKKHNDFLGFIESKNIKKVAYFIWRKPWMIAANNTFIDYLLDTNKFENVFRTQERYPEIELKELHHLETIDCIFLSSEPYPFKAKHITELQKQFPSTKIVLVNGEYFSWYGSRLLKAFDYFKELHYQL
ncbi:helical backbone metal receptor [Polaribacter vadi]|uniref:ABC transporter substrate-binding protein n=1 Tax=Polaribacter vadi TaxID=1774273 RepID=UPI0030ECE187|tara:strand:- start:2963 stop:3754 length:792 start_codon:yes stop_codon:yes gene_type:complete